MSEYTNNDNIYFLNDKNIAQNLIEDKIKLNPIPSLSLLNKVNDDLILKQSQLCADLCNTIDIKEKQLSTFLTYTLSSYSNELCSNIFIKLNNISSDINMLCSNISTDISNLNININDKINKLKNDISSDINNEFVHLSGNNKIQNNLSIENELYANNIISEKACIKKLYVNDNFNQSTSGIKVCANEIDGFIVDSSHNKIHLNAENGAKSIIIKDNETLTEKSLDDIITEKSSSVESKSIQIINNVSSILKEKIENDDTAVKTWASSTFALSTDVYNKNEVDQLTTLLSSNVNNNGYVTPFGFNFTSLTDDHIIKLDVKNDLNQLCSFTIDTTDFIKNRILDKAEVTKDSSGNQVLRLYWFGTSTYTDIKISDLTQLYKSGTGITIGENLSISVNDYVATSESVRELNYKVDQISDVVYDKITIDNKFNEQTNKLSDYTLTNDFNTLNKQTSCIQEYINELSVTEGKTGIIKTLSNDISNLYYNNRHALKYIGHLRDLNDKNKPLSSILMDANLVKDGYIDNCSFCDIKYGSGIQISDQYITGDPIPLYIDNGDLLIVNSDSSADKININDLVIPRDITLVKATVGRSEFEALKQFTNILLDKIEKLEARVKILEDWHK